MIQKARSVLEDCKHAHALLEDEVRPDSFRVLWVAGIALARAVGHVLQKVDAAESGPLKKAVDQAYADWKNNREDNAIFWEFIEEERNRVLKQYEAGFFAGPVDILAGEQIHTLDENLFCPITDGRFSGEDCRDVLAEAIKWWERQLAQIEASAFSAAK
jgi:hypothetical protein